MTTVTIPREVVQQALDAAEKFRTKVHDGMAVSVETYDDMTAIARNMRKALDAPANRAEAFADAVKGAKFYHGDEIASAMNEQVNFAPAQPVSQYGSAELQAMILSRAAQPVDCRGCKNLITGVDFCRLGLAPATKPEPCTNGDKFKPLPIIQLYKVTK